MDASIICRAPEQKEKLGRSGQNNFRRPGGMTQANYWATTALSVISEKMCLLYLILDWLFFHGDMDREYLIFHLSLNYLD